MAITTVHHVADWFIRDARDVGDTITNLKLQKLVYYAQAWYAAIYNESLVGERFEAWVHGPVCPPLYRRFKSYRWEPISEEIAAPALPPEVEEHLREVMEVYGGFSGLDLERLTHREAPWIDARGGLPADAPCESEIPVAAMRAFYKPLADAAEESA